MGQIRRDQRRLLQEQIGSLTLAGQTYRAALTLLTASLAGLFIVGSAAILVRHADATGTGSGTHVYRAERAAISVILRREGRYLKGVRIEALFRCTDGRTATAGFAILGGTGVPITLGGRFNMSRHNAHELRVLKGRVEGDVIRGYFRAFQDGSPERGFEPRCGTVVPNSKPIHFTAR